MRIFDLWRRRRPSPDTDDGTDHAEMTPAERRFGRSCPVCGGLLGKPAGQDLDAGQYRQLPALRLEVQASIRPGQFHWRLGYVDGNPFQTTSDVPPTEVAFEYLLCGNGHIFPSDTPMYHNGRRQPTRPAESWSMVAAVGPTGSGKTYLMLRTLRQSLVNERYYGASDPARMHKVELTPLEEVPMRVRGGHYSRTLSEGAPIPATNIDLEGTPYGILRELMPDLVDEIQRIIRETVVDGGAHAQTWGRGSRQPLVIRTATGGESIWTGVSDLPGELFTERNEFRSENTNLRLYDALVWVVDPVIADGGDGIIRNSATLHNYADVMDGNLRPGSLATIDADRIRSERNNVQLRLGELLAGYGGKWTPFKRSTTQSLAVAVNKCDLIHASLDGHLPAEWKEDGTVHLGVVKYLMETATRFSRGECTADPGATALLTLILGDHNAQQEWRIERARAVAIDLLRHYADPDRFWNLVHVGAEDEVRGDTARGQFPWLLRVPSIGEHLDTSLHAATGAKLLARDLVMSALGSGIVCGLGHVDAVHTILTKPNVDLRFFLCSPLATVPVARQFDGQAALTPLDPEKTFPRVNERSAALTQLLMVMLGKARAWHQ
ncbi:hypothetical protein ACIBCR_11465 [Micromonospora echinospora]|uniref:hypothetical protein n=1 Tax=Micromonospora echinospora TaxID=1877 RepID=UPI0037A2E9DA